MEFENFCGDEANPYFETYNTVNKLKTIENAVLILISKQTLYTVHYINIECIKLMYTLFETLFLSNEMRQIQFVLYSSR